MLNTRILIVDDEASVLAVLSHHLTNEGHECTTTTSPLKALQLLKHDNFALLITDLVMPEMSGLDLVREAKKVAPETSVIIITVVLEVNKAIEAVRAGADDYVLKPFNLGEISTSVSKVIEKRKGFSAIKALRNESRPSSGRGCRTSASAGAYLQAHRG